MENLIKMGYGGTPIFGNSQVNMTPNLNSMPLLFFKGNPNKKDFSIDLYNMCCLIPTMGPSLMTPKL